jgi:hypothetical protein
MCVSSTVLPLYCQHTFLLLKDPRITETMAQMLLDFSKLLFAALGRSPSQRPGTISSMKFGRQFDESKDESKDSEEIRVT